MSAATSTPTHAEHTSGDVDEAVSTVGPISAPMVAALEHAWAAIRARHPDVPSVVIILGAGSGSGPSLKLGHFAAMRWGTDLPGQQPTGEVGERLPEVFVGGEGLARGPAEVLATLLHEAAHALAHVRGVKDTSRQGRWHNARFKALAEELGIEVAKDAKLGWSPTTIPTNTREAYAEVIEHLGGVLRWFRAIEGTVFIVGPGTGGDDGDSGVEPPRKPGPIACDCGRTIRVAKAVLAQAPITCGGCGSEFRVRDEDEQDADKPADDEPADDEPVDGEAEDRTGRDRVEAGHG